MTKILLIEDDELYGTTFQAQLEQFGFSVTYLADSRKALPTLQAERFDLVITDIVMPEKDGLEIIQEIRRATSSIPIIAISGGGSGHTGTYLKLARLFGATEALAKPFSFSQMKELICSLVERN